MLIYGDYYIKIIYTYNTQYINNINNINKIVTKWSE